MAPIKPEAFRNEPLFISSLPRVEVIEYTPLSPKYLLKTNITTSISFLIFLTIPIVVNFLFPVVLDGYVTIVLSVIVLIFFWNYFRNFQWQKKSGYAIRERDIIFKRGFLIEKITAVPFNRVQHVSTTRGVLDKFLGLSTLLVYTAGGSGSDISIPGLTPPLAATLKEALSVRIAGHV